jgi:putative tricarboxylic transport membrane protein
MNFDLGLLILAYVLGPILERSLRQALTISNGDPLILLQGPLAQGFLVVAVIFLVLGLWPRRTIPIREDS